MTWGLAHATIARSPAAEPGAAAGGGPAAPLWRAGPAGEWLWAGPGWTDLTGQDQQAAARWGWLDAVAPDDRPAARAAWAAVGEADRIGFAAGLIARDGSIHRYLHQASWSGEPRGGGGWIGVSLDLDRAIDVRNRQDALLAELQHRSRNTLSTIRSLVRHGIDSALDVEDFAAHLDGRLGAVSRAQAIVTRDPQVGTDLKALIADELGALATREGERLTISGPAIEVPAELVQPLALTMHELATNAVKFGALEGRAGEIRISWTLRGPPQARSLDLTWTERLPRGAPAPVHARRGLGTALIESGLAYQVDAVTEAKFAAQGVCYRILIPLPTGAEAGIGIRPA